MEFSLINLLLVLLVAWVSGAVANRLGYPSILGELAAGIIFGPALLGLLQPSEGLAVLAELGLFLMMLYIGMEVDYRDLAKASWGGLLAAIGGFTVPLCLGYFVMRQFEFSHEASIFLGLAMGVTSLATKSRILVDLNLLGTRIANVLFAAALICDTVALVVFALIMGLIGGDGVDLKHLAIVVLKAVLFFGATITIGLRVFPRIGRLMQKFGFTERMTNFSLVIMIGLVFAELAELAGLHFILGAFLAGMFLRGEIMLRKVSHEVTTLVHDLSLGFLAPIFFVSAGFHVRFSVFQNELGLLLLIIGLAATGKILGACLFYSLSRNGWREGLTIGCGMNGHGAVEIIIAGIALEKGIIDETVFSILIFMAFVTTSSVPICMKWCVDWLRRRKELVRSDDKRSGVLILGATPLAQAVAKFFETGEPVTLIDSNTQRCLSAERAGLQVMHGNALKEETMDLTDATNTRILIAMTSNPEVNIVAANNAREMFGIPETHVVKLLSDSAVVDGEGAAAADQESLLFGGYYDLEMWNRWILRKQVKNVTIEMAEDRDPITYFAELNEDENTLPLGVERDGKRLALGGLTDIKSGDRLHALRKVTDSDSMSDRFAQLVIDAPIMDVSGEVEINDFFDSVATLLSQQLEVDSETLRDKFIQREQDSSTVIVPGLAIPHVFVEGEGHSEMVIARAKQGIQFFGPHAEARIIFVIVGTKDERKFHLQVLSAIAQLFQDVAFEDRWMAAEGKEELRQVVLTTNRQRF